MNKAELVERMAELSGCTKKESEANLNAFMQAVEEVLSVGEKVQLVGHGTYETRARKAREGRNPQDPEQVIHIPACTAPVWKASKKLKEKLNA